MLCFKAFSWKDLHYVKFILIILSQDLAFLFRKKKKKKVSGFLPPELLALGHMII
jgi:hypothetical protein